ncbi:MAG: (2Fe-2S) ferredoxin domain-containing protein [Candidatus Binatia bacterium]
MIKRDQPYERQIFMCINNRHGESPSCGHSGSEEMVEALKNVAKEMKLKGKLRVAKSGRLDLCAFGPNMMIWPEGIWYMKVTKEYLPQIVETYLRLEEAHKNKEEVSSSPAGTQS